MSEWIWDRPLEQRLLENAMRHLTACPERSLDPPDLPDERGLPDDRCPRCGRRVPEGLPPGCPECEPEPPEVEYAECEVCGTPRLDPPRHPWVCQGCAVFE